MIGKQNQILRSLLFHICVFVWQIRELCSACSGQLYTNHIARVDFKLVLTMLLCSCVVCHSEHQIGRSSHKLHPRAMTM